MHKRATHQHVRLFTLCAENKMCIITNVYTTWVWRYISTYVPSSHLQILIAYTQRKLELEGFKNDGREAANYTTLTPT